MEKLVCEICGGRLIMGQKDTFECESCGSCYSREWVKHKVQEIQGTVKVEGTVQVEVKGGVKVNNLLKRGNMALKDGDWERAEGFFEDALDRDPECGEAYLGLFLVEEECSELRDIGELLIYPEEMEESTRNYWDRALEYASPKLKKQLETMQTILMGDEAIGNDWEAADACYDQVLELDPTNADAYLGKAMVSLKTGIKWPESNDGEWIHHREENEYWKKALQYANAAQAKEYQGYVDAARVTMIQKRNFRARRMMVCCSQGICALKTNGRVLVHSDERHLQAVKNWHGIIKIVGFQGNLWGLRADGTVVAATGYIYNYDEWNVESWDGIVNLYCYGSYDHYLYGVKADGTVLVACSDRKKEIPSLSTAIYQEVHGYGGYWRDDYHIDEDDGCLKKNNDDFKSWRNDQVIARNVIARDCKYTYLKANGTVGNILHPADACIAQGWTDVVALYDYGSSYTLGLRSDGHILVACEPGAKPLDLSQWRLFESFDELPEEPAGTSEEFLREEEEACRREEEIRRQKEAAREAHLQKIAEVNRKKQDAEAQLAMAGFFEFRKKIDLKDIIANCAVELEKLNSR